MALQDGLYSDVVFLHMFDCMLFWFKTEIYVVYCLSHTEILIIEVKTYNLAIWRITLNTFAVHVFIYITSWFFWFQKINQKTHLFDAKASYLWYF